MNTDLGSCVGDSKPRASRRDDQVRAIRAVRPSCYLSLNRQDIVGDNLSVRNLPLLRPFVLQDLYEGGGRGIGGGVLKGCRRDDKNGGFQWLAHGDCGGQGIGCWPPLRSPKYQTSRVFSTLYDEVDAIVKRLKYKTQMPLGGQRECASSTTYIWVTCPSPSHHKPQSPSQFD